jgi:hypothetical protein
VTLDLKYTHICKHTLWGQSKPTGRKRLKTFFQYLVTHTLLNTTHSKEARGMQNTNDNIFPLLEINPASGQKRKMPSPTDGY